MAHEVIDEKLANMIRVMADSRTSIKTAGSHIAFANYVSHKAANNERLPEITITDVRVALRECIATLVAVHENMQRAEENLARVKK